MFRSAHASSIVVLAAGSALLALAAPGLVSNASAAQTSQQACSDQYQAAKTAGTLNGQKWSQFYSDCAARLKSGDASATVAPAQPAAASKPVKTAAAPKAATTTSSSNSGGQTTQQICSDQYQAEKTAGTLNGQKWPQFLSSCSESIKNYSSAAVPDEPTATVAPTTKGKSTKASTMAAAPVATTDKDGKPLTAGEIAFRQRIHQCSVEWQSEKQAGTLPSGAKWPQFWSQCNSNLKAQG